MLIDSGPLVALLSERDEHHVACINAAKQLRGPFYTTWPAITEAAHLLKAQADAVQKLLAWIRISEIRLCHLTAEDADGIAEILEQYSDQNFDFADAGLMYLANREGMPRVFTIDYRHFSIYRTKQGKPLSIVPSSS
jgi:predicted nucleic acid-binding protein